MYDPASFRLDEQVAVITGAGAGIGRAIAETFVAAGAAVMVSGGGPKPFDMPMADFHRAFELNVFSLFRRGLGAGLGRGRGRGSRGLPSCLLSEPRLGSRFEVR